MIYDLLLYFNKHHIVPVQFFLSTSIRSVLSGITAWYVCYALTPYFISFISRKQFAQVVRKEGPKSHLKKEGTPTMGGILIVGAIIVSTLLWGDITNWALLNCLGVLCGFAVLGFYDDWLKITRRTTCGLHARYKLIGQVGISLLLGIALFYFQSDALHAIFIPLLGCVIPISIAYILWVSLVVISSSNAVNLTDGLDGLAAFPIALIAIALGVLAYWSGDHVMLTKWHIPFQLGVREMAVFAGAVTGACLGFLWHNTYPASIFMGDVGSLSLGAALGCMAVIIHHEIPYLLMAGIFVLETLSVIIQVFSFKTRGKRVFKMAPIHHHFELSGWAESQVIVRFWIITCVLVATVLIFLAGS